MKAVVFEGNESISLRDVKDPELKSFKAPKKFKSGEFVTFRKDELVRLRVEAASICGTDLHIMTGTHDSAPPVVLGHEFVGIVTETGRGVSNFTTGDKVAVDPNVKCGICDFCRKGLPNHCENMTTFGIFADGGFAPECIVPAKQLYRISDDIEWERAVFFEPVSCVLHAFEHVEPHLGDRVLIYGGGTMGCIFTLLSLQSGAGSVTVVEPSEYRRGKVLEIGALPLEPGEEDSQGEFDVVIDACGVSDVVDKIIERASHGARISLFGQQNTQARSEINATQLNQKELVFSGSYAQSFNADQTIQVLQAVEFEQLVTHNLMLTDFEEAFDVIRDGRAIEVVLWPGGGR